MINGMLRRFTGVRISDFGCAFNAYRRSAVEPMLGSIGRQKFTKALVLSGGASVVEVDVAHAARHGRSRYSPLRLTRLALHVWQVWPQPIQWIGLLMGGLRFAALGWGSTASSTDHNSNFPGPLFGGMGHLFSASRASSALIGEYLGRIQRQVEGVPCIRSRRRPREFSSPAVPASSSISSGTSCGTPFEVVSLDALTYAGNVENLADVMSHERLSFVHGDIRDAALVRDVVANVDVIVNAAESHVEKSIRDGGSEFVRRTSRGPGTARRSARLLSSASSSSRRGGLRRGVRSDGRDHPLNRAARTRARRRAPIDSRTRTS
jgi:hypothetical protein